MLSIRQYDDAICADSDRMGRYKDDVTEMCQRFVRRCGSQGDSGIMIVLRELLVNAIEHGTSLLAPRISVEIRHMSNHMFKVTVSDTGNGFDYKQLDLDSIPDDPRQVPNRGYRLIQSFARAIEFNDKGNAVTVYVPEGTPTTT